MNAKWKRCLPVLFLVLFALSRWPGLMPPNFSAVYGLLFCSGAFISGKLAWWGPLLTLLGTNLVLNVFYYHTPPFSIEMLGTYLAYAVLIFLGRCFTRRASWLSMVGGGFLGAVLFYVVTNTVSWLTDPAYAKTLAGWIQSLTIGTSGWPHTWEFFLRTLFSGGLFTGLFAGAMKAVEAREPAEEVEPEEQEVPSDEPEPKPEETTP